MVQTTQGFRCIKCDNPQLREEEKDEGNKPARGS